jgi:hypothetical protein
MIAFPLALGAWAFGYASAGEAVLLYLGSGFSVMIAGVLSAALAGMLRKDESSAARSGNRVRVDVVLADRH